MLIENYKLKSQQESVAFSFSPRRDIQGKQNCCIYECIQLYIGPQDYIVISTNVKSGIKNLIFIELLPQQRFAVATMSWQPRCSSTDAILSEMNVTEGTQIEQHKLIPTLWKPLGHIFTIHDVFISENKTNFLNSAELIPL